MMTWPSTTWEDSETVSGPAAAITVALSNALDSSRAVFMTQPPEKQEVINNATFAVFPIALCLMFKQLTRGTPGP